MGAAYRDKTAEAAGQLQLQEADRLLEVDKMTAEDIFARHLSQHRTIVFERQYFFAKTLRRMWRFDFAIPRYKVGVEIDGIVVRWINGQRVCMGRHATISGIQDDNEKINSANMLGWHVLRFTTSEVKARGPIAMTLRVLASRGWKAYK